MTTTANPVTATNLTVKQGETTTITATVADGAVLRNLTGYTARMMIRRKMSDASPLLSLTTGGGGISIPTPANGQVVVTLSAAQTAALGAPLELLYDLEIESGAGVVTRIMQGVLVTDPNVTR